MGNKVLSPMALKRPWLSFCSFPCLQIGVKDPRLPPCSSCLLPWGVIKQIVIWKFVIVLLLLLKILICVVENWKSGREFPCFLQHIFAQSPINPLISSGFCRGLLGFFPFWLDSLSIFSKCSFFCLLCASVTGLFWWHISYFPACWLFFSLKTNKKRNNILMCGSMPCFKHLL